MAALPEPIVNLVASLSKLPGIGPRSAERIALHLVQSEKESVQRFAEHILAARDKIQLCQTCGGLTERQPCVFCDDPRRDPSQLCVVERAEQRPVVQSERHRCESITNFRNKRWL